MTKRKLIYPVVILLVFVCLVVIGVLYVQLKDLDTLRDLVAQEIKAETRRDVRIGAAHLDFSEGIGLQLHDVTIKSSSEQESDFTCKEVLVLLRALPLLNGEIEIQKIIFEGLILQVTRDDRGDFNFGNLSSIESHRSGATLTDFIRAGLMHSVQVRQGELWLVDHHISTGAEPLVTKIKNMSLSLTKPLVKTSLRVHLTGEMPYAPDKSGTLKLDGKLRVPREEFNLSQVALEGNLEVRDQGTQPFALYLDKVFAQNPGVHKVSLDTHFAGTLDGHIQLSGVLKHEQPASLQPAPDRRSKPVKGRIDFNMIFNRDTVEFKQLDYRSGNFLLQIQGTYARFMSKKARLTASLKTTPFQIQDGETYLPLKVFSRDLHRRVRRLVKKGEIEITALNIEGPRAIFEGRSNAEIEKYDSGSIILRHADFGVDALPLSDVTGEFKFGKGVAEVTIQQARFDRVLIKNLTGTIVNPITHPRIEVTLEAEAALAPLANTIEKNWTLPRQLDFLKDLKRIQGMVRGRLAVQGPLEHWEQLVWSGNVSLERAGFMKMAWPAPIHNINGSIHFQSAVPKSNARIKKKAPRTWTLRFEKFNGEYGNHYFRDINGASFVKDGVPVKQIRGTLLLGALKAEEVISTPFEGRIKTFLNNVVFESGEIDFDLQNTGPEAGKKEPENQGSLKIRKLFLKHSKGFRPIRNLNATVSFDDRTINLETTGGWYGDSPLDLQGRFENYSQEDSELVLQASSSDFLKQDFAGIPFLETLEYRGPAKVDLKFHCTEKFIKLDKRVDLTRASYRYQDFLIKPENVSNSIEISASLDSGGRINFKKVIVELEGNKVSGDGFLKSMDDPEFSIRLESDHFKVWPASQYILPLQGALGGELRFQFSAKGNFRHLEQTEMQGKIRLTDIEYKPDDFLASFKLSADTQFKNNHFKLRRGRLEAKGAGLFFGGDYRGGEAPHLKLQVAGPGLDMNQLVSDKGKPSKGFLAWLGQTHVFSNGSGEIKIKIDRFSQKFWTLPKVAGKFTFENQVLRTDNLTLGQPRVDQVMIMGKLSLADIQNPAFDAVLISRKTPVDKLFAMFGNMFFASLTGDTLWFKAHLRGRGGDLTQITQNLKGRVSFNLKDGRINTGRLLNGVVKLFEISVDPQTVAERALQPNNGYMQIFGDFQIVNGVARTENFLYEEKGERLSLVGAFDLNTSRMGTVVGVAPFRRIGRIIEKIPILGPIVTGGREGSLITTYYKVEGPFSDPKVEAVPFKSISNKILGTLEGVIIAPSELFTERELSKP
ncbi:MAG: AsmA family protein [Nitrospinae bacterium]|nr:AsmA family protein [Nitrospinota bacterium]